MKKLFLAILFLFSLAFVAKACFPEFPRKIAKVDGVCYAYDAGRWYVAGFEQEQDSIVLKSEVFIDGKKETVEDIYIRKYNNAHDFSSASPRVLVISKGFKTIAMLDLPKLEKLYISKTIININVRMLLYSKFEIHHRRQTEQRSKIKGWHSFHKRWSIPA